MNTLRMAEWVGGAWLGYALLVCWAVFWRGAFQVVYSPVVGVILRALTSGMEATTIGARCYLIQPGTALSADGRVHENFHYQQQWRVYPLTFIPRYFYEMIRYGYTTAPMEVAARKAAGEA